MTVKLQKNLIARYPATTFLRKILIVFLLIYCVIMF